jgi:hypothetical protein
LARGLGPGARPPPLLLTRLLVPPARWRSVLVVSLIERPG